MLRHQTLTSGLCPGSAPPAPRLENRIEPRGPHWRLNEDALSELDEGLRAELMTVIPRVVL